MTTTTMPPPTLDLDTATDKFVRLRDKIKEIKDKHKDELAPYNEMKETLEAWLLAQLPPGVQNVTTVHGNVHKVKKDSATIEDRQAFWNWCVVMGKFDMLDYKANTPAVRDWIEDQVEKAKTDPTIVPAPPPGVNFSTRIEIGVTRAGKKS